MIKAVLAARAVRYRRTHDLTELIDLAHDCDVPLPADMDEVRKLTPFAVEFRYDELPVGTEKALDRVWAEATVRRTRLWAEAVIRETPAA